MTTGLQARPITATAAASTPTGSVTGCQTTLQTKQLGIVVVIPIFSTIAAGLLATATTATACFIVMARRNFPGVAIGEIREMLGGCFLVMIVMIVNVHSSIHSHGTHAQSGVRIV